LISFKSRYGTIFFIRSWNFWHYFEPSVNAIIYFIFFLIQGIGVGTGFLGGSGSGFGGGSNGNAFAGGQGFGK